MVTSRRVVAVLSAACCAAAIAASPAAARRAIRIEPAGEITKVVEAFTITAFGGEVSIICGLTLRGRLAPQIQKAAARRLPEGRMGQITEGTAEGCRTNFGGEARVIILNNQERPINLRYEAFLGILPGITGIRFTKLNFELKVDEPVILGNCLYRGNPRLLLSFPPVEDGRGRRFNDETFVAPSLVPVIEGGPECAPEVTLSGRGRVMPPQFAVLLD